MFVAFTPGMDHLGQDIRYAFRVLVKDRGFTLVVVATLALGIGANSAIFSVVDSLLFRPLPHLKETSKLVAMYTAQRDFVGVSSYADYVDFRDRSRAFAELAAFKPLQMDLAGDDFTERIDGMIVTANYFDTLGVEPAAGRFFLPEEDRIPDANPVVVLGYGLWQRRFGLRRSVLGESLVLHGRSFLVVGVAPQGFRGTNLETSPELFAPMTMQPHFMPSAGNLLDNRGWGGTFIVGRLAEGVSMVEAGHRVAGVSSWLKETYPAFTANRDYSVVPLARASLHPEARGHGVRFAALLAAVVVLVLVVATVNVANLVMARSVTRQTELALRQALGASRLRLIRQLLVESMVLSLVGGGLGLLLAAWITAWFSAVPLPFDMDPVLDLRVLGFTAAISTVTGALISIAPALRSTRVGLVGSLKANGIEAETVPRFRWSQVLVAGQLGLALLLLVTAGLLVQTLVRLGRVELGFNAADVLAAELDPAAQGYEDAAIADFYRRVSDAVESIPGVRTLSRVSRLPGPDNDDIISIRVEGHEQETDDSPTVGFSLVGPNYLNTMRIPVTAGSDFSDADFRALARTVVINETGARLLQSLTGRNPLTARFSTEGPDGPLWEVIGIAQDSKTGNLREDSTPHAYVPHKQGADGKISSRMTLVVRTDLEPSTLISPLGEAVRSVDDNIPLFDFRTLDDHLSATLVQERLSAGLMASFALLTLILASIGLYGIVAYSVSRRSHEFGIRIALGAEPAQIVKLVARYGMGVAFFGVGFGLVAATAASRLIETFLYGVSGTDPATYLEFSALLSIVCLLASYLPARRAARVDPIGALRRE